MRFRRARRSRRRRHSFVLDLVLCHAWLFDTDLCALSILSRDVQVSKSRRRKGGVVDLSLDRDDDCFGRVRHGFLALGRGRPRSGDNDGVPSSLLRWATRSGKSLRHVLGATNRFQRRWRRRGRSRDAETHRAGTSAVRSRRLTELQHGVVERVARDRVGLAVLTQVKIGTRSVDALVANAADRLRLAPVATDVVVYGSPARRCSRRPRGGCLRKVEVTRIVDRDEAVVRVNVFDEAVRTRVGRRLVASLARVPVGTVEAFVPRARNGPLTQIACCVVNDRSRRRSRGGESARRRQRSSGGRRGRAKRLFFDLDGTSERSNGRGSGANDLVERVRSGVELGAEVNTRPAGQERRAVNRLAPLHGNEIEQLTRRDRSCCKIGT